MKSSGGSEGEDSESGSWEVKEGETWSGSRIRGVSVVCSELRGSGRAAEKGAKGKREDASGRESWVRMEEDQLFSVFLPMDLEVLSSSLGVVLNEGLLVQSEK